MSFINNSGICRDASEVNALLKPLRALGKTVATTNGCFDLIHAGHIQYLQEAAAQADLLVVGINSDASVQKLKGKTRPVQNETDRLSIICSLKMVDFGFIFPEDDPREFLKIIKPDVHVKGGDYTKDLLERSTVESCGGRIYIVSFKPGCSTTNLIGKIGRK